MEHNWNRFPTFLIFSEFFQKQLGIDGIGKIPSDEVFFFGSGVVRHVTIRSVRSSLKLAHDKSNGFRLGVLAMTGLGPIAKFKENTFHCRR